MAPRSARELALAALSEWRRGERFADAILQNHLVVSQLGDSDRAFATELFYGTLRNLTLLDFWIGLLRRPSLDDKARDLLRLGLYQLIVLRTPAHAAVFEMVALASSRQRSLVNAILRSARRRLEELETAAKNASLATGTSHPEFLIDRWTKAFGAEAAQQLSAWDNQPAPIYARVNPLKNSLADFRARHPDGAVIAEAENFLRFEKVPLAAIERGDCYIQDPSTRIACELLNPQPGENVLDACAAPGGKSSLLAAQMQNRGLLVACDRDAARVQTMQENVDRLGVSIAQCLQHDWRSGTPPPLIESLLFDRILIDAPCTNTGVMRRRVDVRWRLQPRDFGHMKQEQLSILRAVVPHLKTGGAIVYSTCSLEREENEEVVASAASEFPFLELAETRSVFPFRDHFDGAFAARLQCRG
ncbi:MAG: 16S rRNA (cytosine(967)-C(5))-methyltransferase RsmB [Chthoniobacterales bacterium]